MVLVDSGSRPYDVNNDLMKSDILKIANDEICETGRPIDLVFDSRVRFSGTADRMDLLLVAANPRQRSATILEISIDFISGMSCLINFMFDSRMGFLS